MGKWAAGSQGGSRWKRWGLRLWYAADATSPVRLMRGFDRSSAGNDEDYSDSSLNHISSPLSPSSLSGQARFEDANPVLSLLILFWTTGVLVSALYYNFDALGRASHGLVPHPRPKPAEAGKGFLSPEEFRERARKLSKDGWIILLVCNYGFHDFFSNWAYHAKDFRYDEHFVAITEDEGSYEFVEKRWPGRAVRLHVPALEDAGTETLAQAGLMGASEAAHKAGASVINSADFLLIMYRRLFYVKTLMLGGLDVLLCDVDIIFLQDPFPYFTGNHDMYGVIEIQDKIHYPMPDTAPLERASTMYLCGGFLYFRSNPKAFLILDHLLNKIFRAQRKTGTENDQTFLRFVLLNLSFLDFNPSIGVLPQQRFPPGWLFFGNAAWRKLNFPKVVMIHNNWIRGKQCKMIRWLQYGFWRVPGDKGKTPTIEWSITNDNGMLIGIRDKDWRVEGLPKDELPSNATDCKAGLGIIHRNELSRWW